MKFMFDSFHEWAEIMGITPVHPNYEAFIIVWNMARSPASLLGDENTEDEDA